MTKRIRVLERPELSVDIGADVVGGADIGVGVARAKDAAGDEGTEGLNKVYGAASVVNTPIAQSPALLVLTALTLQ